MLITHYRQTPIIEKASSSTLSYQSHLLFIGNSFQTTEPIIYNLAARAGFEPANDGVKVRCVTISPPGNKW